VLPRGEDEARAAVFLRENAAWVLEQLAFQDRIGPARSQPGAAEPESLLLRGHQVRIELVTEPARRSFAVVEQRGQTVRVRVPEGGRVDGKKALEAWL